MDSHVDMWFSHTIAHILPIHDLCSSLGVQWGIHFNALLFCVAKSVA